MFDALSYLVEFGGLTDEQIAGIDAGLAELQAQCYDAYDELQAAVEAAESDEAAAEACTQISSDTAAAVELVNSILQQANQSGRRNFKTKTPEASLLQRFAWLPY